MYVMTYPNPYYLTDLRQSSSLARHRRIHSGERNYICEVPECRKEYVGEMPCFTPCLQSRRFCRKTTLTKHAKKHPVEHSCIIDDDGDESADDDWDSDPEDSAHEPIYSTPQALSRSTSCFGNHWPLPAETVQQTKFGKHPHRLETNLEAIKLERSSSSSPGNPSMTNPISTLPYIPTSNGISRKPPPVRTQTLQDYRSIPMSHQFSSGSPMETFQSPTSLGSPDAYAQFPSQPGSAHSQTIFLQQPRYNTYPQPPRVHDIRLDDPMQMTHSPSGGVDSMAQFPDSNAPLSAQSGRYALETPTSDDQLQHYLNSVSVPQTRFLEPQPSMMDDITYQVSMTNGPVPEWYTNIKPEETWPGYDLPNDRIPF